MKELKIPASWVDVIAFWIFLWIRSCQYRLLSNLSLRNLSAFINLKLNWILKIKLGTSPTVHSQDSAFQSRQNPGQDTKIPHALWPKKPRHKKKRQKQYCTNSIKALKINIHGAFQVYYIVLLFYIFILLIFESLILKLPTKNLNLST